MDAKIFMKDWSWDCSYPYKITVNSETIDDAYKKVVANKKIIEEAFQKAFDDCLDKLLK